MAAPVYRFVFRTVLSRLDPENAHRLAVLGLSAVCRAGADRALEHLTRPDTRLRTEAMGLEFPSPFGLAMRFDKGGRTVLPLAALGFGHIEVGTVTGQAQPGNPRPRMFRLVRDRALINRMGFNNDGAEAVRARLEATRHRLAKLRRRGRHVPAVGVNLGKTKAVPLDSALDDYVDSARLLAPVADYLVVNVSSPNTPGLRQLQSIDALRPLLEAVRRTADSVTEKHVPLLVKIAPDLADEDIDAVADLIGELSLDGVIATNTSVSRKGLVTPASEVQAMGAGGLSGPVLAERSLEVLARLRRRLPASATIISVGAQSAVGCGSTAPERS